MDMTFALFYEQTKIALLGLMFFFFLFSFIKDKYLPFCYLIILSFMPGTLFDFLAKIRFELLFFFCSVFMLLIKNKLPIILNNNPINKKLHLFFIIMFISVFQAVNISFSWDYFYSQGIPQILFYILIISFITDVQYVRPLLYCYLLVMIWHAYLPVFNYITGTTSFGHERIGTGGVYHHVGEVITGHVGLANTMTQSLPVAYYLLFYEKKPVFKIICLFSLVLFTVAIFASGSRGGVLGLFICGALFFALSKKKLMAASIGIILIVVFLGLNPHYLSWYSSILDGSAADVSASSRIAGLKHGIEMCIRRPILGVGIGCFSYARSSWFGWNIWAHNHYGELIGELGLLGVFTWFGFIVYCFKEIKRMKQFLKDNADIDPIYKTILDMCWVLLVLRLVLGMTTHSLLSFIWYFVAGILVVTAFNLGKNENKVQTNNDNL